MGKGSRDVRDKLRGIDAIFNARSVAVVGASDDERKLGFQVPELLRAIFLKVGNGGFGPQYGIVGTRGGFKLDECSLESCYQRMNPTWARLCASPTHVCSFLCFRYS